MVCRKVRLRKGPVEVLPAIPGAYNGEDDLYGMLDIEHTKRLRRTYYYDDYYYADHGHPTVEVAPPSCALVSGIIQGTKLPSIVILDFFSFFKVICTSIYRAT